jgi:prophage regulatory protein
MKDRYIRKPELLKAVGLSASTIWRMEKKGLFPKRKKLSSNSVAWSRNLVEDWMESRSNADGAVEA